VGAGNSGETISSTSSFFFQLCFLAAYLFDSLIVFIVRYAGITAVDNAKSEHMDVDFDQYQIMERDLKGMHDYTTMLLVTLELSVTQHHASPARSPTQVV